MNPYKYKCGSCLETYIEIHDLQDHIEKEHPEEIEDQEEDMEIESEQPDEIETEPDIQSEIGNNDESMEKNMVVETEEPDKMKSFHMNGIAICYCYGKFYICCLVDITGCGNGH